jgi:hypothetical protein
MKVGIESRYASPDSSPTIPCFPLPADEVESWSERFPVEDECAPTVRCPTFPAADVPNFPYNAAHNA